MRPVVLFAEIQFPNACWSSDRSAWPDRVYGQVADAVEGRGPTIHLSTFATLTPQSFGSVVFDRSKIHAEFQITTELDLEPQGPIAPPLAWVVDPIVKTRSTAVLRPRSAADAFALLEAEVLVHYESHRTSCESRKAWVKLAEQLTEQGGL